MIDRTVAKYLALYFFEKRNWKFNNTQIAKQISCAKNLLGMGFTEEEIKYGIDYYTTVNPPKSGMYSLGYLNNTLNTLLEQRVPEKTYNTIDVTVGETNESSDNNRRKFNNQSRFGEKYSSDLFKETREND